MYSILLAITFATCAPSCQIDVHFVSTEYGSYSTEQQTIYIEQTKHALEWWQELTPYVKTSYVERSFDISGVGTRENIDWLRPYFTPDDNKLHVFFVYSPKWNYQAWTSSNITVLYVQDTRDIEYILSHEYGHLIFHMPDMFIPNDIMGYDPERSYVNRSLGNKTRENLNLPTYTVYLPMAMR